MILTNVSQRSSSFLSERSLMLIPLTVRLGAGGKCEGYCGMVEQVYEEKTLRL